MNSARILTVDPANPKAGNFKKLLRAMSTKEITGWSVARNLGRREEIRRGDCFLFLLQGDGPKGIPIASRATLKINRINHSQDMIIG